MDFYEELVLSYLTSIKGLMVRPQVPIVLTDQNGKVVWEAYPDFLAVDFEKKQILIVEVSKSWRVVQSISNKLQAEYRIAVEKHIRQILKDELPQFPIHWHFVVRNDVIDALKKSIDNNDLIQITEVTSLECVLETVGKVMP